MEEVLEYIQRQIQELRNLCAPFELKLAAVEGQIAVMRALLDERIAGIESRLLVHIFDLEQQELEMATLLERLEQVELALKAPLKEVRRESSPVREDKGKWAVLPRQSPAA